MELDLYKGAPTPGAVTVRRGDLGALRIEATVLDHGVPLDVSGWTASFLVRMPSGEFAESSCEVDGGGVRFTMPSLSTAGRSTSAYIELERDGISVTTQDVEVRVVA